jgi:hypothetical protein
MMRFFHRPYFSLHRVHESNLQRLFLILPEWFAYMEHKITYLDQRFDPHIIEGIMGFLEQNRTLLYCNLGLFYWQLSRRLLDIMRAHPSLYRLEMTSVPDLEPTSLYRHEGRIEWHYLPN